MKNNLIWFHGFQRLLELKGLAVARKKLKLCTRSNRFLKAYHQSWRKSLALVS